MHVQERYQIRIRGQLDSQWADWFGGMTITCEDQDETVLTGPVTDQAALFGMLTRVRDLGLTLLAVNRVENRWLEAIVEGKNQG
jgi:hypothetical protein